MADTPNPFLAALAASQGNDIQVPLDPTQQQSVPAVPDVSALPPTTAQVPQAPTPQPQAQPQQDTSGYRGPRPILMDLIQGLIKPRMQPGQMDPSGVQGPPRPVSRAATMEDFLGNFVSALGAGFAAAGHGPGAAARGAGAAIGAPLQMQQQQQAFQSQQQLQQAQLAGEQQRQAAYPLEQQAKLAALTAQPRFDPKSGAYVGNLNDAQFQSYLKGQGAAMSRPQPQQDPKKVLAQRFIDATTSGDTQGAQAALSQLSAIGGTNSQVTQRDVYMQKHADYRASLMRQQANSNEIQRAGLQGLEKQSEDYTKFLGTAATLKESLQAAQNGNEMAAAVAPLQGTLFITTTEGVKRINETELSNVRGAGSLVERINGALGKQTGSGPLSDQLKQDMGKLVDLYTQSKFKTYRNQANYTMSLHGLDSRQTPVLDSDGSITTAAPSGFPRNPKPNNTSKPDPLGIR